MTVSHGDSITILYLVLNSKIYIPAITDKLKNAYPKTGKGNIGESKKSWTIWEIAEKKSKISIMRYDFLFAIEFC